MKSNQNWNLNSVKHYLETNEKKLLSGGKSGARLYDIDGKYVLKQIVRTEMETKEQYEAYRKEAWWYAAVDKGLECLPEVFDLRNTEEEICILMKQYQTLFRQEIHKELLEKIMKVLASVHTAEIPLYLQQHTEQKQPVPQPFSEDEIQASVDGWQAVLDEHQGVFNVAPLGHIAEDINRILLWHNSEEPVLCHGDFHWDNLLQDDQGRILLCDWQGVEIGQASGDLSFFFGRLRGDGIELPERTVIEAYAEEVWRLSGKRVMWEEIDRHIRAANVITSFTCWYQYLHGSREERVREIYQKMVTDYESISISFT